jgi:hypothetical protein
MGKGIAVKYMWSLWLKISRRLNLKFFIYKDEYVSQSSSDTG